MKSKLPEEALNYFRKEGAKGGKIGGKRSLETMTPEERSARAKKASEAAAKARSAKAAAKRAKSSQRDVD
ncbi:MAG TPA: hypothetical protein VFQ91_19055 [Bryobacteraceae bacterium]|nr:hypothetical protein [Bryobacteraceae bacterium]